MIVFVLLFSCIDRAPEWIVASRINTHKLLVYHRTFPKVCPKVTFFPVKTEKGIAHCHFETNRMCQLFQMWQEVWNWSCKCEMRQKIRLVLWLWLWWCKRVPGLLLSSSRHHKHLSAPLIQAWVSSCRSIILVEAKQGEAPATALSLTEICGSGSQIS